MEKGSVNVIPIRHCCSKVFHYRNLTRVSVEWKRVTHVGTDISSDHDRLGRDKVEPRFTNVMMLQLYWVGPTPLEWSLHSGLKLSHTKLKFRKDFYVNRNR